MKSENSALDEDVSHLEYMRENVKREIEEFKKMCE